ncbi:MAG: malate dehydrogenase [Rickettsiales bacterium]|jgi:malate dehydrogenase|nr:malate dehydrogenase [Rickettsiales bacterium]
MKLSFIGSGDVSCTTAFAASLKLGGILKEIVLLDIRENWAKGNAIDMTHASVIDNTDIKYTGTSNYADVKGSDVIVITAGRASKPGVLREELLASNKQIISSVANELKKVIPTDDKQPLIIVLTNPLDLILNHFINVGGFNKKKTIGSGNWLDSNRFKEAISKEINVPASKINTFAVAQHGQKIVYLLSKTTIDGKPLTNFNLSQEQIERIKTNATEGANEIIKLLEIKSTSYGPALSILDLISSYIKNEKKIVVASVYLNGEYGITGFTLGVPIVLGKNGIEEIKIFDLPTNEKTAIEESYKFCLSLDI